MSGGGLEGENDSASRLVLMAIKAAMDELPRPTARKLCLAAALLVLGSASEIYTFHALLTSKPAVLVPGAVFSTMVSTASLAAFAIILIPALRIWLRVQCQQNSRLLAMFSMIGLAGMAAVLVGHRRLDLQNEWCAHLAGESGHDPADWQKAAQAFGFVVTAVKLRSSDAADTAWVPVDAILRSRALSNLFVFLPTGAAAYLVLRHEGTLGLVKAAESIIAIGAVLYALIHTGRRWRNIKPPQPKARRPKK